MSARYAHSAKRTHVQRLEVYLLAYGCMVLQGSAPIKNDSYITRLSTMVLRANCS
jgi:hypothetical protein